MGTSYCGGAVHQPDLSCWKRRKGGRQEGHGKGIGTEGWEMRRGERGSRGERPSSASRGIGREPTERKRSQQKSRGREKKEENKNKQMKLVANRCRVA